jgi:hypothetical protein
MNSVPRRDGTKKGFRSPDGLALLAKATGAAKKDNDARAADPWTSGGAKNNQPYREPMNSVTVVAPKKKDE